MVIWLGKERKLGKVSKSCNADGSPALSNEELGERLVEIADTGDDGKPKPGRRYYYLALSSTRHGRVQCRQGIARRSI